MKYRIFYQNGRWHVREPNGEITWHFDTLIEAGAMAFCAAIGDSASPIIATENEVRPPLGDNT